MIRRGQIIFLVFLVLLLSILIFVGCNKNPKNVGISNEDAQKLSLDGITVAGNGTANISNLIRDKSGKENNMKKRETSGDGQILYDITVNYIAPEGFDINLDKTSAKEGDTITFRRDPYFISENEKFEILIMYIAGDYTGGEGGTSFITGTSFVMPGRDVEIHVQAKRLCRITKATNIQHGDIQISKEWLEDDDEFTVTLNPENGYHYKNDTLLIHYTDGYEEHLYPNNNIATRAKEWVRNPAYITCEFEQTVTPKYNVEVSSPTNGTISVNPTSYEEGSKVVVNVTPDNGYELESLTYNNTSIPFANNEYSFTMPNYDVTLSATFKEKKYLITVNAENGNVVLKHDNNILVDNKSKEDQSIKIYVSPDSGYLLESIRLSDSSIVVRKNEDNYEFIMPPKDITLTASFVFSEDAVAIGPPYIGYITTDETFYNATDGTHYEYANGITIDLWYMDNLLKFEDDSFRAIYCIEMKSEPNGAQNVLEELISNSLSGFFIRLYDGSYQPLRAYFADNDLVVVYDIGEDSQKAYLICTLFENNNTFYASNYSSWIIESTQIFFYVNE
ncbi:MAG: hypothetical protein J5656_03380 [Clostridia bacterium]|nr:hypothetical protein [Clostridia bacterium]